jgi:hypothetical protein
VILLKQSLVAGLKKKVVKKSTPAPGPAKRQQEQGVIYFP